MATPRTTEEYVANAIDGGIDWQDECVRLACVAEQYLRSVPHDVGSHACRSILDSALRCVNALNAASRSE